MNNSALLILQNILDKTLQELNELKASRENLENELADLQTQEKNRAATLKDLTEAIENLKLIEDLKKQESEQNVPKRKSKKT